MAQDFVPGDLVRLVEQPGWGIGQVQSVVGDRATVNFENAGKQSLVLSVVTLVEAEVPDKPAPATPRTDGGRGR